MDTAIRLLHVDDEPAFADLTAEHLRRNVHQPVEVVPVTDPEEALERLDGDRFDCVVSDYDMPSTNGIALLEAVRERYPHLPFILFTGKGSEEVASEAIAAGVTDYLQKGGPERFKMLANRIENAVSQSQLDQFRAVMGHEPLALLDRFSDPLFALDTDWRFTFANEATAELFDTPREDLVGADLWGLFPAATETAFYERYREALETGEAMIIEEPYEPWDRWFREYLYPAEDGLTIVSFDITEEREQKRTLERNRELRRHTEALTNVGGWEFDRRDEQLRWTEGTHRIHGTDPGQEFTLEEAYEFYHPEDRQAIQNAVKRCLDAGESYQLQLRIKTADGELRWIQTTGEPVWDGDEIVAIRGACHDITARKEREEELLELSEFKAAVLESANVWINVLDEDGSVILWNEAAEKISGYTAEEVIGSDDIWEELYPDTSYRQEILADVEEILEGRKSVDSYTTDIETKAGDQRTISWHSHAITDAGGELQGSVAIGRDVTTSRQRKRELERYQKLFEEAERLGDLGAWEIGEDGSIVWTDGTYRIHEYDGDEEPPREEAIEFFHPEDRDELDAALERAFEEDAHYDLEVRLITPTGEEKWVRTRGGPVEDGGVRGFIQDITESKARERELRAAKTQLEGAIEAGEVGTWDWDVDSDTLVVDSGMATRFGVDPETAASGVPVETFLDAIHPADRQTVENAIETALSECAKYQQEYRIEDATGETRWVVARGAVQCNDEGEPIRFPGTLIDITGRKEYERELEETRAWYERILQHSSDYVIVVNPNGIIEYASPAIERITGFEPGDVIGTSAFEYVHDEDMDVALSALGDVIERPDEEITIEYRAETADGSYQWVEVRGRNYLDEPLIEGVLVNVRVIDDRKADEQALERSNTILSTVLDNHTAGVLVEGSDREVLVANEALIDTLGLDTDPADLIGRDFDTVTRELKDCFDDPTSFIETIERRTGDRTPVAGDQLELTEGRQVERDYVPYEIDDEPANLWIYRDVSDRYNQEEALRRQINRLDEFASVISHDLRSPLMVAKGRLDLIDDDQADEHIQAIDEALTRMETMIEDLLELARAGNRIGGLERIELEGLADQCWRTVETREATLEVADSRMLEVDVSRTKQLLENLFRNAVEHGGDDVTVTIGALENGFFVEDNGPGIPPDERDRIFEAGYSTGEEGSGFGLSIVYAIAEAHGWEIAATDATSGGARFEFTDLDH